MKEVITDSVYAAPLWSASWHPSFNHLHVHLHTCALCPINQHKPWSHQRTWHSFNLTLMKSGPLQLTSPLVWFQYRAPISDACLQQTFAYIPLDGVSKDCSIVSVPIIWWAVLEEGWNLSWICPIDSLIMANCHHSEATWTRLISNSTSHCNPSAQTSYGDNVTFHLDCNNSWIQSLIQIHLWNAIR